MPYCRANGPPTPPPQHGRKGSRQGNREPIFGAIGTLSWGNRRGNGETPAAPRAALGVPPGSSSLWPLLLQVRPPEGVEHLGFGRCWKFRTLFPLGVPSWPTCSSKNLAASPRSRFGVSSADWLPLRQPPLSPLPLHRITITDPACPPPGGNWDPPPFFPLAQMLTQFDPTVGRRCRANAVPAAECLHGSRKERQLKFLAPLPQVTEIQSPFEGQQRMQRGRANICTNDTVHFAVINGLSSKPWGGSSIGPCSNWSANCSKSIHRLLKAGQGSVGKCAEIGMSVFGACQCAEIGEGGEFRKRGSCDKGHAASAQHIVGTQTFFSAHYVLSA